VAASPDHPDGYFYLSKAYPEFLYDGHTTGDFREFVTTANLARCRARIPDEPGLMTNPGDVIDVCRRLIQIHRNAQPPRLDLRLDMLRLYQKYESFQVDQLESQLDELPGEERGRAERDVESRRKQLGEVEKAIQAGEKELQSNMASYINLSASKTAPLERAAVARRFGLVGEAIAELRKSHEALQRQPSNEGERKSYSQAEIARHLAEYADLIELMLYAGQAEEAVQILDAIDVPETVAAMGTQQVQSEFFRLRFEAAKNLNPRYPQVGRFDNNPAAYYRALRQRASLAVGDHERVVAAMKVDLQMVQDELAAFRSKYFPGTPPTGRLPGADELQGVVLVSPLLPVPARLGLVAKLVYIDRVQSLRERSAMRVHMHVRLALVYLEWGDVKSAAHHFRLALDAPEFSDPLPAQIVAREHLAAIESATGRRGTLP
jgi:hypothetical protein